jgi:hypothetical protein
MVAGVRAPVHPTRHMPLTGTQKNLHVTSGTDLKGSSKEKEFDNNNQRR